MMDALEKKEFIGKKIRIIRSNNESLVGKEGMIVDESKNTIDIISKEKTEKIIKSQVWLFFVDEGEILDGKKLTKRPHERLKMKR